MMVNEGGNVFKRTDGGSLTQRINQADVPATVKWIESVTGLPFPEQRWLGTTGRKSSSGDLDLSVDASTIDKETLIQALLSNGVDRAAIKKSGDSVHVLTPIAGDPTNGYVQSDLMFGEPEWQSFSMSGAAEGSKLTGMSRHVILASIVNALNPALKWSYKNGLVDRVTNATIENGKSPATLSKVTGIPVAKLNSPDDIVDAISKRADYSQLIAAARDTLAKSNIELPESAPTPGTAAWFRSYSDKFAQ
jgi:hypothetical protein